MLGKGAHNAHVALDMYSKCVERCLYISVMADAMPRTSAWHAEGMPVRMCAVLAARKPIACLMQG